MTALPQHPFDFLTTGELPAPGLPIAEADDVLRRLGVGGRLEPLGSQQDQNLLVVGPQGPFAVLKLANPAFPAVDSFVQDSAAALVADRWPELRVPGLVHGSEGPARSEVATSQGPLLARVLEFLPGGTFVDQPWLSPRVAARMGRIAAQVSEALKDLDGPGLQRRLQWNLQVSKEVVDRLAEVVSDPAERTRLLEWSAAAWSAVRAGELPVQPGHFDLTDDNLVRQPASDLPDGVIDFGDLSRSWRVGELAVTVSGLLHHTGPLIETVVAAVRGWHQLRPLTEAELDSLWPLVVLRGAVLVVSGRQQAAVDSDNDYVLSGMERETAIWNRATSLPIPVMTAVLRQALGTPASRLRAPVGLGLLPAGVVPQPVGLEVTSPLADDGAWREPTLAMRALAEASPAALGWGLPRVGSATGPMPEPPASVPTSASLHLPGPTTLKAPWPGELSCHDGITTLSGPGLDLVLTGLDAVPGAREAGAELGTAEGLLEVQLVRQELGEVPLLVRADEAPGWLSVTADPGQLLGWSPALETPATDLLTEREAHLAEVQEHYYDDPPRIERGWGSVLLDTDARPYLDMVNNVTSVGHAHPRIRAAVHRQLGLLNTNSRFHYRALPRFASALADRLPQGLDQVFLVNSGSEATDLAIRLAQASTGRLDMVALAEAYHGWTFASDAVSTSLADNPNALATRPDWVHTLEAPNPYRGRHRDEQSGRYGPEAAARIRDLVTAGRPPAGFIAEAIQGNAGGILLPQGYLSEVYRAVREAGGVTIADEVQVGYGRLGDWFWGFEQQAVVPDIVAVAKGMGNGHPLGAVITTAEIAAGYRAGGYFFSSAGGSPVSAVVGLEVLAIIEEEGLQENARRVGSRLRAGLQSLADRHSSVGTVHGNGLYLGLELVADRDLRTPATSLTADLCERLRQLGVIMQPTGDHGNVLKIKPPLVVTSDEVDHFVAMVDLALGELRPSAR